jgi:hypothetical protein
VNENESFEIDYEGWVVLISNKDKIVLDKPIYIGATILDDSKAVMYDFYYNEIKRDYGDKAKLLYMDTDSLIIGLETKDLYKDEITKRDKYDLSNQPSEIGNDNHKAALGYFKDEYPSVVISEFIGCAPKVYSIETVNNEICKSKCKGSKQKYNHEDFKYSLFNDERVRSNFKVLRGINHKIYSMDVNKWGINSYFDKRYFTENFSTMPFGHYSFNQKR